MKKVSLIILLIFVVSLNAQSTTKITFKCFLGISTKDILEIQPELRQAVQDQIAKTEETASLSFLKDLNYYETNPIAAKKITEEDRQKINETTSSTKLLSMKIEYSTKNTKIRRNSKTNEIITENDVSKKEVTQRLVWQQTTETKKILNYNCKKAIITFKDSPLTIYYTKEIPGKASPKDFPFIDGVILEYQYKQKSGIATKVEFNQPDIKDFFK